MVEQEATKRAAAPYIPFKTFLTAVSALGTGLPIRLDRSAWPSFSGNTQTATLVAFRFLGLVDLNGFVRPVLREWVNNGVDSEGFKQSLLERMRDCYPEVHTASEGNATIAQLQEAMRGYGVSGSTLGKAVRFWTEAAAFVGLSYPVSWKRARGAATGASRTRRRPKSGVPPSGAGDVGDGRNGGSDGPAKPTLPKDLHPVIAALISDLASEGATWDEEQRDLWKRGFDTIFDYAYPAQGEQPETNT